MTDMRIFFRATAAIVLIAGSLSAATITTTVASAGTDGTGDPLFRYMYDISGLDLSANEEIDIRFDPAIFRTLQNPLGPAGFDLLVFQPNNPPGAFGDLSALTSTDRPGFSGAFSVDATTVSGTPVLVSQPFFVNSFDQNGQLLGQRLSGSTVPSNGGGAVPEPGALTLTVAGFLIVGVASAVRRR